jgi:hypothetical protein
MPMSTIPASAVLVAIQYSPDGLSWARLYDHRVTGWICDETGAAEAQPVIIGSLPLPAPDTSPIVSPRWALIAGADRRFAGIRVNPEIHLPGALNAFRGTFEVFLTWLATNNGARRPLGAALGISAGAINSFARWSQQNPDLVYSG